MPISIVWIAKNVFKILIYTSFIDIIRMKYLSNREALYILEDTFRFYLISY